MSGYLRNLKIFVDEKDINDSLYEYWDCHDGHDKRIAKIIMEGDHMERHFCVVAHHTGNPNAYVEVFPWDSVLYDVEGCILPEEWRSDALGSVHCGSTYYGGAYWNRDDNRTYLGWDYGHAGDYQVLPAKWGLREDAHKWTVNEILMDIARANLELETMNDDDENYYNRKIEMKANRK